MKLLRHVRCSIKEIERALNALVDAVNERTPRRGPGFLIFESPSGWSPRMAGGRSRGGGGGGIDGENPFEVVPAGNSETTGAPMVKVALESWLLLSQRFSDKQTITGLGEPFEIGVNEMIWLEIAFDDEVIDTATIQHGPPWGGYDSPVEFDDVTAQNKKQTYCRLLLAYTQPVPDPNPYTDRPILTSTGPGTPETMQLVQCVTTHVRLCRDCFEADTVQLLNPYFAPGPVPTS